MPRHDTEPGRVWEDDGGATADPLIQGDTLNRAAAETFGDALKVAGARGVAYADSWAIGPTGGHTPFLDEVLGALPSGSWRTREAHRLVRLAAMIDTKLSRMAGGFREDTVLDLVVYMAAYRSLRLEYDRTRLRRPPKGEAGVFYPSEPWPRLTGKTAPGGIEDEWVEEVGEEGYRDIVTALLAEPDDSDADELFARLRRAERHGHSSMVTTATAPGMFFGTEPDAD